MNQALAQIRAIKTPQHLKDKIDAMLDSSANKLDYMYGRWQDESEFEDWSEYADAMQKFLPDGFEFVRATKRPFGFEFRITALPGPMYSLFAGAKGIGWKRVV